MMHKIFANYGDKNFLEYGTAVEVYINDQLTVIDTDEEIRTLYCRPFDDDDVYLFADCTVNINDTWICDVIGGCTEWIVCFMMTGSL